MGDLDNALLLLGDLVGFPTVTSDSNLELIEYVAERLAPLGAEIRMTFDESGLKANLLATIGPRVDGGVVVSGHSDVVPAETVGWTGSPFVAARRGDRIYGRGTADMKGFLACAIAMAPAFAVAPLQRPLHVAITFDEEIGCLGAPILLADLAATGMRPTAAIIGEPTGMSVVTAHKGMYEYTTRIVGLEGHGSAPRRGVNAVEYGARYIAQLLDLAADLAEHPPAASPYDPPHTTISVGTMSGGTARNVIAGESVIEWEVRPATRADMVYVLEEVEGLERRLGEDMARVAPGTSIERTRIGAVGGLEPPDGSPALGLVEALIDDVERIVVPFSTEAGLFQEAGIPAVVCGPGDIDVAHRPDEHIHLDQLSRCVEMLSRLVGRLSAP